MKSLDLLQLQLLMLPHQDCFSNCLATYELSTIVLLNHRCHTKSYENKSTDTDAAFEVAATFDEEPSQEDTPRLLLA